VAYQDNIVGQILHEHLIYGELIPGSEIGIRIDQTLTQDATGTLVYLEFMSLGIDKVQTKCSVSYIDHNTLQTGSENADDHLFLQSTAARYGVHFSRPGNGICHQVHLERFGVPGQTLLGSDSHTPSAGGIGMLGIGAGGIDVSLAMASIPFSMTVPKVMQVRLSGKFPAWVGAKDVILYLLSRLTVKGGVGKIIEYGGPTVKDLSIPDRATITNMGAELGAWSSLFPSDEITKQFLNAQKRGTDWAPIHAHERAAYDEIMEIDLSQLEPLVACPSSPDAVKPVKDLSHIKVDQVAIGSCTNSSYRDLKLVAELLKGNKVHPHVSLVIAPGSRQVLSMLAKDGSIGNMIDAGARILEVACGPCIGMGQAPPSGGVSVRTFNRNFQGRSGTPDAKVYLASPQVAVATALTGHLVHPNVLGTLPVVENPDSFLVDDSMIIPPSSHPEEIIIRMGPNIKPIPRLEPMPDTLNLKILLKTDDNITTDDILPAGAKALPYRSNLPAISEFVFTSLAPGFAEKAKAEAGVAIIGGENFGQGSSREHAALALRYLGVQAVLIKSISRLYRANLINFGIIPLSIENECYEKITVGDDIHLTDLRIALAERDNVVIRVKNRHINYEGTLNLSKQERMIIAAGGRLNFYGKKLAEKIPSSRI
jgi:aconitate hydratase